jgi:peptidase E
MWRLHGYDSALRSAWESGVVLTGISAGSLCWHAGGTTDSFGPELRAVRDGLALVPFANSVHHDIEEQRRPLFNSLVARGELPTGYATDDGVGLVYRGTELAEVVSEEDGKAAYRVEPDGAGGVIETLLEPRLLPPAH